MPKPARNKFDIQENRLDRELDDSRAKPHPETSGSESQSTEEPQIADITPSEMDEPRRPGSIRRRDEPEADPSLETQLTEVSEDEGSTEFPDRDGPTG